MNYPKTLGALSVKPDWEYIETHMVSREEILADFGILDLRGHEPCWIWDRHDEVYWRKNCAGYTKHGLTAGVYDLKTAFTTVRGATSHKISFEMLPISLFRPESQQELGLQLKPLELSIKNLKAIMALVSYRRPDLAVWLEMKTRDLVNQERRREEFSPAQKHRIHYLMYNLSLCACKPESEKPQ